MSAPRNHYEVLGVAPDATPDEVRRAYLGLARRFHPDRPGSGPGDEARMREVNAAWAVLGSEAERDRYDRSLSPSDARGASAAPDTVHRPSSQFRPYDEGDDDDSWRYEPDEGDPASAPPQPLLAAPPVLFALGFVLVVVGVVAGLAALVAVGMVAFAASLLLFLGAPVVALFRSRSSEERARRRR